MSSFLRLSPRLQSLAAVAALLAAQVGTSVAQVTAPVAVPASVRQAMRTKFPAATKLEWKLKTDRNYEAEFTRNGGDIAVKFDSTGKWLETESAIAPSKVPAAVTQAVSTQFKGYQQVETQTLQRWNEPALIFELHLANKAEIVKVQFAGNGTILTRSSKPKPPAPKG